MASLTEIVPETELRLNIAHEDAAASARRAAAAIARTLSFSPQACEEIALATAELASNLVKHARNGCLAIRPLTSGDRVGLEIETQDKGPGILNLEEALTDGFSTTGSLGTGLGTVNRLMDELEINSEGEKGTKIVCRKWLHPPAGDPLSCPLAIDVATRAMLPGQPNGDQFVIKQWAGNSLVGIIDGLGHGLFAHRAAQAARQYVETHYDRPLEAIFQGVGHVCRSTRGVVMALARFDWKRGRLSFASVGNIEARVLNRPEAYSFVMRRGIVGVNAPKAVVTEHDWDLDNIMVLHSDGLSTHWGWKDFPAVSEQSAAVIAREFFRALARENDDATVLVVRKAAL